MDKTELTEFLQDHNRQEAADHFGVHLGTIKRAIKRFGIKYKKKSGGHPLYRDNPLAKELTLTKEQSDIMTGCLLGDGFVLPSNIFRIKQESSRREYIDFLYEKFLPFSTPVREDKARKPTRINGEVSHKIEDWCGEYCCSTSFSTRTHSVFSELRDKWYPHNIKIIPNIKLNALVCAHWFVQDGQNRQHKREIILNTNSFIKDHVEFLIEILKRDIGIKSHLRLKDNKYFVIVMGNQFGDQGYFQFLELVSRYNEWECFRYKFDISEAKKKRDDRPGPKLDIDKARQIRALHETGNYTQKQIGVLFGVEQPTVSNIVNNLNYIE